MVHGGYHSIVIQIEIKPNAIDKEYGRTALHWAAISGNKEAFEYILKQIGVDINAKDYRNKTPLEYAREKGLL